MKELVKVECKAEVPTISGERGQYRDDSITVMEDNKLIVYEVIGDCLRITPPHGGSVILNSDQVSKFVDALDHWLLNRRLLEAKERVKIAEDSPDFNDDPNRSDLSNDLHVMKAEKDVKRAKNVVKFLEVVVPKLKEKRLKVEEYYTNSFRISDGEATIDYYPASGKLNTREHKKPWKQVRMYDPAKVLDTIIDCLTIKRKDRYG